MSPPLVWITGAFRRKLMALLICAATVEELTALAPSRFSGKKIPEMQLLADRLKQRDVIFLVTGVGPVNAALACGYALGLTHATENKIDAILCVGLAGAFDLDKTPLLSIWRISEEIWPEYGLNDGIMVTPRAFRHPQWLKESGEKIYERISLSDLSTLKISLSVHAKAWPQCASLTVAGVTASFNRRDALFRTWGIPLENMEGFACAFAAARAEIPCAEIRVVSNKTGPRAADEKNFEGAMKRLEDILPELGLL